MLRWHRGDCRPAECRRLTRARSLDRSGAREIRACRICVEQPLGPAAAARAAAGAAAVGDGAHPDRQPGAGHQGASLRHAVHRRVRRPAARLARRDARGVLRSRGISPSCRWASAFRARTPRAATCRRAANARRPGARRLMAADAADRAGADDRPLRAGLALGDARRGSLTETVMNWRAIYAAPCAAARAAAAASVLAQHRLAEAESLV